MWISLTGEEIIPSDQRRVIEQAKFTYCFNLSLTKSFKTSLRKTNKNDWKSKQKASKSSWRSWETIGWM